MNSVRKYMMMITGLLALYAGSPVVIADEVTIKVVDYSNMDYCGKSPVDNEVLFALDAGVVSLYDSLHYFEVEVEYDPSVIKMETALFANTLAGKLEERNFTIVNQQGLIYGAAGNWHANKYQAFGDLPLVAFQGRFIAGDCNSSSAIKIKYVFFGSEYKKTVAGYQNLTVATKKKDKAERKFDISLADPLLEFKESHEKNTVKVNVSTVDYNKVARFDLTATSSEKHRFTGIVVNGETVKLLNEPEWINGVTKYELELNDFTGGELAELVMTEIEDVKEEFVYSVTGEIKNDCNCITKEMNAAEGNVISEPAASDVNFNWSDDFFKSIEDHGSELRIYFSGLSGAVDYKLSDLLGNLIREGGAENNYLSIDKSNMAKGIYILSIAKDRERKTLKLNLN